LMWNGTKEVTNWKRTKREAEDEPIK